MIKLLAMLLAACLEAISGIPAAMLFIVMAAGAIVIICTIILAGVPKRLKERLGSWTQ